MDKDGRGEELGGHLADNMDKDGRGEEVGGHLADKHGHGKKMRRAGRTPGGQR
jgi:hypothetical protein